MSENWKTCRQMQVACAGCGKMDSCTISPDATAFKCWRDGGRIIHLGDNRIRHPEFRSGDQRQGGWMTLHQAAEALARRLGSCTGRWKYADAQGQPVMAVLRFDGSEGKQYRPLRWEGGMWRLGDPPGALPLYRLPEVIKAQRVWVCEGEKAAEAGRKIDLLCTTSAHGAAAPLKSDWSVLAGKEVIILPDQDAPGLQYAQTVARTLLALPNPPRVKIVQLPGRQEGEDLYDYLQVMEEGWESVRQELEELAQAVDWLTLEQLPEPPAPSPAPTALPSLSIGSTSEPVLTDLASVRPESVQWLWEGKLALGKLSGLAGAPGDGKSIASLDIAARITTGAAWPDKGRATPGSVLLITAEDGLADTIRPRLDVHEADVSRVKHMAMLRRRVGEQVIDELFTLSRVAELEQTMRAIDDLKLVIIDPVGSFFGTDVDAYGDAAVRSVLAPIAALAERQRVAVLLIMHTRKDGGERADDAVMGSRAFTGIVRCMWHVRRDAEDLERRLFLPGKNNASRTIHGLAYAVVDQDGVGRVQWEEEPVMMTADEAVRLSRGGGEGDGFRQGRVCDQVAEWLGALLSAGPRPVGNFRQDSPQSGTLVEEARTAGHAWRTVQRAATHLGVLRSRDPGGAVWRLPNIPERLS